MFAPAVLKAPNLDGEVHSVFTRVHILLSVGLVGNTVVTVPLVSVSFCVNYCRSLSYLGTRLVEVPAV